MEEYIENLPDSFPCCIFLYNNLYKTTQHPEYNPLLIKLNSFHTHCHEIYFYTKVLLIQKMLLFSGEFLEINYSLKKVCDVFIPKRKKITDYVNIHTKMCLKNRKSIHHNKSNLKFVIDLLDNTRKELNSYGLVSNVVIAYLFDVNTINANLLYL